MIEELRKINKYQIDNNIGILERQLLIEKILKDDECFFKINIETAYQILRDLSIKENDIRNIYSKLIDISNY